MLQDQLFYDSVPAALAQVVNALGGCAAVGKRLWPSKPVNKAEQKLANCLNPEHEWKLDVDELVQILSWAREEGIHFGMHKLCEVTGYEPPQIKPRFTERQKRARERVELAKRMQQLEDEDAAEDRANENTDNRVTPSDTGRITHVQLKRPASQ